MENNVAIEFKNVSKKFKDFQALKDINFKVEKGQFHGFIGGNGAGKTTSFRCLFGFYTDYTGDIIVNGINTKKDISYKQKIGYVPEVSVFPKKINVLEFLQISAGFSNLSMKQANNKIDELKKRLNVNDSLLKKNGNELSSGQQKKILLMQALINEPDIIVLDEPAGNLDPKIRTELYQTLQDLSKEGKTILISSHILAELEKYIDSYTVLEKGKVCSSETIEETARKSEYKFIIELEFEKEVKDALKIITQYIAKSKLADKVQYKVIERNILLNAEQKHFQKILVALCDKDISILTSGQYRQSLNDLYFNVIKAE